MSYGIHDGDIISLANYKAGALTMSVDFQNYRENSPFSPETMWRSQTAIRSVVGFKVASIASVPFHLFKRDDSNGRTRVRDGALAEALATPGFRLGQARFLEQLQLDMAIYGRWAFTVGDTDDGTGYEFMPLPAHRIAIVVDGRGRYTDLAISTAQGWKLHSLDDIVFDISRGPTGGGTRRFGYSDLETLTDLAAELSGMAQYRRDLFLNSAMVPAVIERPANAGKWSDEAWTRFKAEISNYRAGGGKAGGWPILEDGMQLKPVSVFDPKSAQYVEVRELHLKEAAQALHIPPELVGAVEGTHSNIIALREQLYVDVLGTDIKYFEDAMNAGLKKLLKPGQYIEANLDAKLRGTLAERAKIYNTASGRPWMSTAEVRSMENLEYKEGTDELVTPLNVLEGGQASPTDSAPEDNGQDIKDGQLARVKGEPPNPKARGLLEAAHKVTDEKFDAVNAAAEEMAAAGIEFWHGYTKRMAKRLGLELDGKHRSKALAPYPSRKIIEGETKILEGVILDSSRKVAHASSDLVLKDWNPNLTGFAYAKQENWLAKAARSGALQFEKKMEQVYAEAVAEPETWKDALIGAYTDDEDMDSWMRGGATESASFGGEDAAKATGVTHKRWIVQSKNPRETHKAQNGMLVAAEDFFPNGQEYPGDWEGGAAEVLNCQCRLDWEKPNQLHPMPLVEIAAQIASTFIKPTAVPATQSLAVAGKPLLELTQYSAAEAAAIRDYTMGSSGLVNAQLRRKAAWDPSWGPYPTDPTADALQSTLDGIMKRNVFKEDTFLQRRVPQVAINDALEEAGGDFNKLVGLTLRDDAFLSTSEYGHAVDATIFGSTTLNIMAPQGTHGAYIGANSYFGNTQHEVLLAPGNSMEILDARQDKKGNWELDVVLIQDGA